MKWRSHLQICLLGLSSAALVLLLVQNWEIVRQGLLQVGGPGILVLTLTAAATQALLFLRWQLYLRQLGQPIPWHGSLAIYCAGLALIAVPGRSGDFLRSLWLTRRFGSPGSVGISVTLAEQLTGLLAAGLVFLWGWGGMLPMAMGGVGLLLVAFVLSRSLTADSRTRGGAAILGRLGHLQRPGPLMLGISLATTVWLTEAYLLVLLFDRLGTDLSLAETAVLRTAAGVIGVLSMLPAGLGSADLSGMGLAMHYGAPASQAVTAMLLLRGAGFCLPALVGLGSLLRQPDLWWEATARPSPAGLRAQAGSAHQGPTRGR